MYTCTACTKAIQGAAHVMGPIIVHAECREHMANTQAGRPHPCPQCKTSGKVDDRFKVETHWVSVGPGEIDACGYNGCRGCGRCGKKKVERPVKVPCDLCAGRGYCATEPSPVMGVVGWQS